MDHISDTEPPLKHRQGITEISWTQRIHTQPTMLGSHSTHKDLVPTAVLIHPELL